MIRLLSTADETNLPVCLICDGKFANKSLIVNFCKRFCEKKDCIKHKVAVLFGK